MRVEFYPTETPFHSDGFMWGGTRDEHISIMRHKIIVEVYRSPSGTPFPAKEFFCEEQEIVVDGKISTLGETFPELFPIVDDVVDGKPIRWVGEWWDYLPI